MKRTERVGSIIHILTRNPNKAYSLQYFCDFFGAAKSSISEDIKTCNEALDIVGMGRLETETGAKGGVKFVPHISKEALLKLQEEFCEKLSDSVIGGYKIGLPVHVTCLFFHHVVLCKHWCDRGQNSKSNHDKYDYRQ